MLTAVSIFYILEFVLKTWIFFKKEEQLETVQGIAQEELRLAEYMP